MKKIKLLLKCIIFMVLLLFCMIKTTDIMQRKKSDFKYIPFFEQEENTDVLFMGTSHVINGIFPMELWNDYGIVSYNFGGHSNEIATTYWVMKNALDYTKPKLVVVDVYGVGSDRKVSEYSDYIHLSFDCFPISKTKIRGIYDLCDDPDLVDKYGICYYDRKWEYIWDLGKYHSRWNALTQNDFTNEEISKEKGAETRIAVSMPNEYKVVDKAETMENPDTVGMKYLRRLIEDCQAEGIEVLLVNLPYPATYNRQIAANSVYAIAEEYGVNYINFVAMDNIVNYNTDCYDPNSHLNASGARKVTDYLGLYIDEHYDVPDRRNDKAYQSWFADYQNYVDFKLENLKEQTEIETELMLLAEDDSFSCCIYIKDASIALKNEKITALLMNICGTDEIKNIENSRANGNSYFLLKDSVNESVVECLDGELMQDTSFGKVTFLCNNEQESLYIGDAKNNLLDGDKEDDIAKESDIRIYVIDNRTGTVAYSSEWDYKDDFIIRNEEEN